MPGTEPPRTSFHLALVNIAPLQTGVHGCMLTRRGLQTPMAVAGGAGLGASLVLIHIYVAPIKRFLQALWALGFSGGLYLAATQVRPRVASPTGAGFQGLCSCVEPSRQPTSARCRMKSSLSLQGRQRACSICIARNSSGYVSILTMHGRTPRFSCIGQSSRVRAGASRGLGPTTTRLVVLGASDPSRASALPCHPSLFDTFHCCISAALFLSFAPR